MPARVHLVGVAGAGMAPLAGLLRAGGDDVSGSDVAFDPPMGPLLAGWGVKTLGTLDPGVDLVVVGNVCRPDHPLAVDAHARGLRRVSMPTALRERVFTTAGGVRPVVAVAGTHGKTTTTALLAYLLSVAGLEPGWLIGGVPIAVAGTPFDGMPFALGRTTRSLVGAHPLAPFVVEGDEYDSAFFEKVPKMWGYAAQMAILTSIEHDHVDIYPDPASYRAAFQGLLDRLPSGEEGGLLVANAGDRSVVDLVKRVSPRARVVWYAASDVAGRRFPSGEAGETLAEPPTWSASEVGLSGEGDAVQPFDLFVGPTSAGRFGVGVFGVHNVANTLAAIALAAEGFGIRVRDAAALLAAFRGVKRRLERLVIAGSSSRRVDLYDDFAHHPTAIHATLATLRARHRAARLIAVYEPRSATACRIVHQHTYVDAFAPADVVVLAPLGRLTIAESERLDLPRLAGDLRARGREVDLAPGHAEVVDRVLARARAGDVIVCMSNGTFGGVTTRLAEELR